MIPLKKDRHNPGLVLGAGEEWGQDSESRLVLVHLGLPHSGASQQRGSRVVFSVNSKENTSFCFHGIERLLLLRVVYHSRAFLTLTLFITISGASFAWFYGQDCFMLYIFESTHIDGLEGWGGVMGKHDF